MNDQVENSGENGVASTNNIASGVRLGCGFFGASVIFGIPIVSMFVGLISSAITGQKTNQISGIGAFLLFICLLLIPALMMGTLYLWFRRAGGKGDLFLKGFLRTGLISYFVYFIIFVLIWIMFSF